MINDRYWLTLLGTVSKKSRLVCYLVMAGLDPDHCPQAALGNRVEGPLRRTRIARRREPGSAWCVFETTAEPVLGPAKGRTRGRSPQDEDFLHAIKGLPLAEECSQSASRSTHRH